MLVKCPGAAEMIRGHPRGCTNPRIQLVTQDVLPRLGLVFRNYRRDGVGWISVRGVYSQILGNPPLSHILENVEGGLFTDAARPNLSVV